MKTPIRLSRIASDPEVIAFFKRGERDSGQEPAVPAPRKPVLVDGPAKQTEDA